MGGQTHRQRMGQRAEEPRPVPARRRGPETGGAGIMGPGPPAAELRYSRYSRTVSTTAAA